MKVLRLWSPPALGLALIASIPGITTADPYEPKNSANRLDLLTAVQKTIKLSPTIQEQMQSVESSRGALMVQSSAFDLTLGADIESAKEVTPLDVASTAGGVDEYLIDAWIYGASATKTLRSGQSISASVSSTYTDENLLIPSRTQTGAVDFTFTQPLLQGRGRKATAASEDAAHLTLQASEYDLRYTIESQILATVRAYWDYQAAALTFELRQLSEKAIKDLQQKSEELIKAEVLSTAERHKLDAELASKRVDRISASQDLENARHALGLAMGLDFDQIESLPLPSTSLPDTDLDMLIQTLEEEVPVPTSSAGASAPSSSKEPGTGGPPKAKSGHDAHGTEETSPKDNRKEPKVPREDLKTILARRNDRLALIATIDATERSLEGTSDELKPSLDLSLGTTLQWYDQETDLKAWDPFTGRSVDPAYTATLTLSYPVGERAARGAILASQAALRQTEIQLHDLERTIRAQVRLAGREVETRAAQLGGARTGASSAVRARHAEEKKLEDGKSSVIDVLSTEDRVVQAGLQVISAGRAYADAIAQLRFESGLLRPTDDGAIDLDRLTAIPGTTSGDSP